MKIQAPYISNLFEYASFKRISEDSLRKYLIDQHIDVCNQDNTVTEIEYLNVFEAILEADSDENFGIHYGCYLNIKALGFIVQLSLNASSIEQAVLIVQNYLQTTFPLVSLKGEQNKGKYILSLSSEIDDLKLKGQVLDFVFCFIYRELRLMLSDDLTPELEVPNSYTAEFSNFLNAEIRKGKGYNFVFDSSVLNVELNRKKVKKIEILLPKYLQMLDKKKSGYEVFSMQVRNMILNMCSPELPTFEQVSSQFPLSDRAMQRKLTEEGLSFRKITNDIKYELSNYLSKGGKIRTQDIAYFLGYSDSSAYLHAVKKWKTEFRP